MKTAAVIIEKWKLQIFEKHLNEAGYSYEQKPGITADTLILSVSYEWVAELQPIIESAQKECAMEKKGGTA